MRSPDICPIQRPELEAKPSVADVIEANLARYWRIFATTPGAQAGHDPNLEWIYSGTPYFNRIVSPHLDPEIADTRIREIRNDFHRRKAALTWIIGPTSSPANIGERLGNNGFASAGHWSGMARFLDDLDVPPAAPSGTSVFPVDSADSFQDWISIVCRGYDFPDQVCTLLMQCFSGSWRADTSILRPFIAYADGSPAAACTLMFNGETAGIYLVATLPEAQGRGLGTLVTWHALQEAKSAGRTLAVLQATGQGSGIYRRLGFEEYCGFDLYRMAVPGPVWRRAASRLIRLARRSGS